MFKIFCVEACPQAKAYGTAFKLWSMYILHSLKAVPYAKGSGQALRLLL